MTLDELKQILEMVREHELAEFEFEQEGVKMRLRKHASARSRCGARARPRHRPWRSPASPPWRSFRPAARGAGPRLAGRARRRTASSWRSITSPIVGTFYRAPRPRRRRSSRSATRVRKGQVLCIIEAMKLMNEIESECDGEIVRIYVENGQPVQYGERLFAVKR